MHSAPLIKPGVSLAALFVGACAHVQPAAENCGLDEATRARAQAVLTSMVERGHAPGVAAEIRCDGKPWITVHAGFSDREAARAMKPGELFRIYSMTKPVTAVAALILVDDGKLALDAPVSRYLPEFATTVAYAGEENGKIKTAALTRAVTVRDLMRHTAGIPYRGRPAHPIPKMYVERGIDDGSGEHYRPTDGSAPVDSAAELSRRIASIPLMFQPGERFSYGSATDVLGQLVETVTGQRLGAFFEARLFAPLGMKDTGFRIPEEKVGRLSAVYGAASQRPNVSAAFLNMQPVADLGPGMFYRLDGGKTSVYAAARVIDFGGAGLVSTVDDYHRFAGFLMGDGTWQGRKILTPASLAELRKDQLDPAVRNASRLGAQGLSYGLGIGLIPPGTKAVLPEGALFWGGAASTHFWVDPARRISAVIMTQVFGGDASAYFVQVKNAIYQPAP